MFKKIVVGLIAIVTGFSMLVFLQPDETFVTRTIAVAAPAPAVFDHVNTLSKWDGWSPWAKIDPNAKITFDGPASGVGSAFAWSGNDKVGEGRMKIIDSQPGQRVHAAVEFVRPFEGKSTSEFSFEPSADRNSTNVTWRIRGQNDSFLSKAICLIMGPEKILGPDMDKGLAQLKTAAETSAKPK